VSHTATACVTIQNRLGLHARPAMMFVEEASGFGSEIRVRRTDSEGSVDGKSIMQIMLLAATQGVELEVVACGEDAQEACDALCDLFARGFDEE